MAPRVDRITVSWITALPEFHPEAGSAFQPFPVHAFLIHHPEGAILVDTGVGLGNAAIDSWYRPRSVDLRAGLATRKVDPDGQITIINTHLHFDHCGQNNAFPAARFVVQSAEVAAARQPAYTVKEWATLPPDRTWLVTGDAEVAEGVSVMHTPGHTPGHQAVVVRSRTGTLIFAGQCIFRATDWDSLDPPASNLHDENHREAAVESIVRLRALRPNVVYLSHDRAINLPAIATVAPVGS